MSLGSLPKKTVLAYVYSLLLIEKYLENEISAHYWAFLSAAMGTGSASWCGPGL